MQNCNVGYSRKIPFSNKFACVSSTVMHCWNWCGGTRNVNPICNCYDNACFATVRQQRILVGTFLK